MLKLCSVQLPSANTEHLDNPEVTRVLTCSLPLLLDPLSVTSLDWGARYRYITFAGQSGFLPPSFSPAYFWVSLWPLKIVQITAFSCTGIIASQSYALSSIGRLVPFSFLRAVDSLIDCLSFITLFQTHSSISACSWEFLHSFIFYFIIDWRTLYIYQFMVR